MVEHDLAKVGVASSSLVSRSNTPLRNERGYFLKYAWRARMFFYKITTAINNCPGGGIGRHAGLKILWIVISVRVQLPSRVLKYELKR